jgi:hypothetical protein
MIGLAFQGQLGNQLFQYATARIQAERLGCGLVVDAPVGRPRATLSNMLRQQLPHQIFLCFPSLKVHPTTHWLLLLKSLSPDYHAKAKSKIFPRLFNTPRVPLDGSEIYDTQIWKIDCGTWLTGFFQSKK